MRKVAVGVMVENVGDDQRRPRQPRDAPHRRQVRLDDEIAIALRPVGRRVARHRLHVDIVGQQIVAAVGLLVGAFEEEFHVHALADEAALHVGEGDDDGVDLAAAGSSLKLLQGHHARHRRTPLTGSTARATEPARDDARADW